MKKNKIDLILIILWFGFIISWLAMNALNPVIIRGETVDHGWITITPMEYHTERFLINTIPFFGFVIVSFLMFVNKYTNVLIKNPEVIV